MTVPRPKVNGSTALPFIQLSDGSVSSKTAPPTPTNKASPSERARLCFAVKGHVVVTGGAGDIGSVACRALLEHGLEGLAIFDIYPLEGDKLVNVTDEAAVNEAVAQAEALFGTIDIGLCFAGITQAIHALDISAKDWRKMFEVNTAGAFLVAIILIASISAFTANFPQPQVYYNASKAALISAKGSLAAEWARYGIRVNSISPGYMDTILNEGNSLEEYRRTWVTRLPYGRMGQPEELTGAVILLCSSAGNYITGADILVDGGITIF
ncbi:hypothetical protein NUU61_000570 [Penicillium alfredii]|uniref:Uncharacterized protein n=1 Tax=Penicillium alfredii TaxID=1506179 RepID=A0A9W9KR50_9EURO|nr:uncharacterized protein NUU61_000570 [Penicillium alfredii]KAJ5114811.1 hypothetical protein NUU61_000570 [Penicillium alfredii]